MFVVTFWGKKYNVTVSGDEIRDPSRDKIQTVDPDADAKFGGTITDRYYEYKSCKRKAEAIFCCKIAQKK